MRRAETTRENPDTIMEDLHKHRAKLSRKFQNWTSDAYYNPIPSSEEFLAQSRRKPARKAKQHA